MRLPGDLIYLLFPVAAFAVWALVIRHLRQRQAQGNENKVAGPLLLGPLHVFLRNRQYTLSRRELIGWLIVGILMASAPLIARVIELS
jgi:hypothetical protein